MCLGRGNGCGGLGGGCPAEQFMKRGEVTREDDVLVGRPLLGGSYL